jgi:hypothetical protein
LTGAHFEYEFSAITHAPWRKDREDNLNGWQLEIGHFEKISGATSIYL